MTGTTTSRFFGKCLLIQNDLNKVLTDKIGIYKNIKWVM
jgi:hypothetical protein